MKNLLNNTDGIELWQEIVQIQSRVHPNWEMFFLLHFHGNSNGKQNFCFARSAKKIFSTVAESSRRKRKNYT